MFEGGADWKRAVALLRVLIEQTNGPSRLTARLDDIGIAQIVVDRNTGFIDEEIEGVELLDCALDVRAFLPLLRCSKGAIANNLSLAGLAALLLGGYLQAWEGHDLDGFVALLKEDATFTMPPWLQWYAGRARRSGPSLRWRGKPVAGLRLVPTAANGQPAFAVYERGTDARWAAHSIHVLTLEHDAIGTLTAFVPPTGPQLFHAFGLPRGLADATRGEAPSTP